MYSLIKLRVLLMTNMTKFNSTVSFFDFRKNARKDVSDHNHHFLDDDSRWRTNNRTRGVKTD